MSLNRLGPWLWLLCLQYFVAEAIVVWHWNGLYSFRDNVISDLAAVRCEIGAVCSPWHGLMNASFLLQGLLILGGAGLNRDALPASALGRLGLALIGASGLGVIVVGLAPEDVAPGWHYLGAAENFIFCNLGMVLLSRALASGPMRVATLGAGALGLLGLACLGAKLYFGLGEGVVERIVAYPFPLWLAAMGGWLMRAYPAAMK